MFFLPPPPFLPSRPRRPVRYPFELGRQSSLSDLERISGNGVRAGKTY